MLRKRGSADVLEQYAHDFRGYCRDVLGVDIYGIQEQMGQAIDKHGKVAVAGCHSSGKTFNAALIVNWWVDTREPAFVLTTAPGGRQVRLGLWRWIGKLRRRAKKKLPGKILTQELRLSDDRMAVGFSTASGDAAQGLREASNVLVIEDEATSVDNEIHESLETILTDPSSRHVLLGNPTTQAGHFYDAFHRLRESDENPQGWRCINISAFETPNVQAGRIEVPGLVTREWVEARRRKWGESSPPYVQRVLGQFCKVVGATLVVPTEWVQAARARWDECPPSATDRKVLCADIAASDAGDCTSIYLLHGRRIVEVETYHEANLLENARRIAEHAVRLQVNAMHIDSTGVGLGAFQELERLAGQGMLRGADLVGCNLGESANDEMFHRKLSSTQWAMRNALDPNNPDAVAIDPNDDELAEQLSWRTWRLEDTGKIRVESKKELRKRTGKSPDRADAVMLAFYEIPGVTWFTL